MSYIKIELGGKERGLKFNTYAMVAMQTKSSATDTLRNIYAVFWGGLQGNCFAKEIDIDFNWEDITEWVDDLSKEDVEKVAQVLLDSQKYKALIEPEEEKKSPKQKKK